MAALQMEAIFHVYPNKLSVSVSRPSTEYNRTQPIALLKQDLLMALYK
jgi:hypothetical protein